MLLDVHRQYQKGFLPAAGGIGDQPHHLMQAIRTIEDRIAQNERDRQGKKHAT